MKVKKMSLQTRRELIEQVRSKYQQASWREKNKVLDRFIETTGYNRKYVICLLNGKKPGKIEVSKRKATKPSTYNEDVYKALLTVWNATNQICSKRLAPFLPELIPVLERCGHLSVSSSVRTHLLTISPATIDRLLKGERHKTAQGISTTRPGNLLKHQIQIRTFADWNDVVPGFFEADLVAHCGGRAEGAFLSTLVLTDIASGWTECISLLSKSAADVIAAINYCKGKNAFDIKYIKSILPFAIVGLDTDNGSEFINYELLKFCADHKITFTRSRAYRKNDQAHIEEKNGSIVRKLIGYDRYEGTECWRLLANLYSILRLYINFFQPSVKLISKERKGSRVTKRYDKAQTPYQRLVSSSHISDEIKNDLKKQYDLLDPVELLRSLEKHQDAVWKSAWKTIEVKEKGIAHQGTDSEGANDKESEKIHKNEHDEALDKIEGEKSASPGVRRYRRTKKARVPRTWRTHKDPFETVWEELQAKLEVNPAQTAKNLMDDLILQKPDLFHIGQLRTLQRRVAYWRKNELNYGIAMKNK